MDDSQHDSNTTVAATKESKRTRQFHTRSRAGCVSCRQRHIRCDESQPKCKNCVVASKPCGYAPPKLPLRERRAQAKPLQPWEQTTWSISEVSSPSSVSSSTSDPASNMTIFLHRSSSGSPATSSSWQMTPGTALDPFDALPIKMPLRSRELFYYFIQTGAALGVLPQKQTYDCIALVFSDPDALRNTLLIAGLHRVWNAGDLRGYESTYTTHKVEGMQLVNSWLGNSRSRTNPSCARQIATLCFTECCLGNFQTAATHAAGLLSWLDVKDTENLRGNIRKTVDAELVNRYLVLIYNFVHGLKSEFHDFTFEDQQIDAWGPDSEQVASTMHEWDNDELGGLPIRLKVMRMFPYFFSLPPSETPPQDIDAQSIIACLADVTEIARQRHRSRPGEKTETAAHQVWVDGSSPRLLVAIVKAHITSLFNCAPAPETGSKSPQRLMTSWLGVVTAVGFYVHYVLGLWNGGKVIEGAMHRRLLLILQRQLDKDMYELKQGSSLHQDLWLWKAFIGAFGLARVRPAADDRILRPLVKVFHTRLRVWCSVTKITQWRDVRAALSRIVWPTCGEHDFLAERLWGETMKEVGGD